MKILLLSLILFFTAFIFTADCLENQDTKKTN